jgi:predicted nucleic acid-binding protein
MSRTVVRLVVDASVAVKWFVSEGEAGVAEAFALKERHATGARILSAPSHVVLEVLNALRSRGLGQSDLEDAASRLLGMRLDLAPVETLAHRAAGIAAQHRLTVYDAAFVALAESLDAELVTADRSLAACPACRTRLLGS